MVPTTTGIAFSISTIGLAFCGIRFFKAFKNMGGSRSGNHIGILLSSLFLGYSVQHGILAIGGLFFSQTPKILYAILVIDHFAITLFTALAVYLTIYILLPKISPWPATIFVLIFSIFVNALTIKEPFLPFVTIANSIDWNMPHNIKLLWYNLLLIGIGLPFLIFVKNFFIAKTKNVRNISLVLMLVHLAGIVNVSLIFSDFLSGIGKIKTSLFDIILAIIGIVFIVVFLLTPLIAGWISRRSRDFNIQQ